MIELSQIATALKLKKSVGIISHVRPDGDTIGSAFGLKFALDLLGVQSDVICSDPVPSKFDFILDGEKVFSSIEKEYDCLVAIDCADVTRLGDLAQEFINHKDTILIDHHVSNTRFAKTNFVQCYAANAVNVYFLITQLGVEPNKRIANALASGIMTDTGRFCHKDVQSTVLVVASHLIEKGADLNLINKKLFVSQSKNRAKLFGKVMQSLRYFCQDKVVVATVTQNDLALTGAQPDETEGFIEFIMGIEGVEVGACLLEIGKNKYKISLRSNGETNVNAVASDFGGGGHILASGCQIAGEYEEVVDKITFSIKRQLPDVL